MKLKYILLAFSVLVVLNSCSDKQKTSQSPVEQFREGLTQEDSVKMLQLCDNAMEQLKQKELSSVLSSLCEYDDSTKEVKPLSSALSNRYERIFNMFPVLDYKRVYYSFFLEGCNDVKYEVTFATAEQAGTEGPVTTMYMFNPVKVNGEWKLCVKSLDDDFDRSIK